MSSGNMDAPNKKTKSTYSPRNSAFGGFLSLIWQYKFILAAISFLILINGAIKYKQARGPVNTYFCSFTSAFPEYSSKTQGRQINNNENLHGAYTPRWLSATSVDHAKILGWALSTDLVDRVGDKVQYDVNYFKQGLVSKRDIYDTTPLFVEFLDCGIKDQCVLEILSDSVSHKLTKLNGVFQNEAVLIDKPIELFVNQEVKTPFGRIVLRETGEPYERLYDGAKKQYGSIIPSEILVEKSTKLDARLRYDTYLTVYQEGEVVKAELSTDRSPKFGLAFLQAFLDELNLLSMERYISEQKDLKNLTVDALRLMVSKDSTHIASMLAGTGVEGDLKRSESDLKLKLSALANELEVDELLSLSKSAIIVIDPPKEVPGKSSKILILLINVILAALVPLFLLYAYIAVRRVMLGVKDIPQALQGKILSVVAMFRRKCLKPNKSVDALRLALEKQLKAESNPCILLAGLSSREDSDLIAMALLKSYERKGIQAEMIRYNTKNSKKSVDSKLSIRSFDPQSTSVAELAAIIQRNKEAGKTQIVECSAIARNTHALELTPYADIAVLLHQLGRSSINHSEDAQHFIDNSHTEVFATWLRLY